MLFLQWRSGAKSASWQLPRQSQGAALSQSHADQNPMGQVGLLRSTGGIPALLNSWWPSTTHLTPHLWADPETSNTSSGTLVRWHKTYFRTNTSLDWSTDKKGGCWPTEEKFRTSQPQESRSVQNNLSECTGRVREGRSTTEALTQGLPPLATLYSFQISHLEETKEKTWKNKRQS